MTCDYDDDDNSDDNGGDDDDDSDDNDGDDDDDSDDNGDLSEEQEPGGKGSPVKVVVGITTPPTWKS